MASMSDQKGRRLLRRVLLAAGLVLACSAIALVGLLIAHSVRFTPRNPALASHLVGTWAGDIGNIVEFRPDGTGRARSPSHPERAIMYFEWTTTEEELQILPGARQDNLRWKYYRYVAGSVEIDQYQVRFTSHDQFQSVDAKRGTTILFTKTDDAKIEAAP
jgi:hypothetical protein